MLLDRQSFHAPDARYETSDSFVSLAPDISQDQLGDTLSPCPASILAAKSSTPAVYTPLSNKPLGGVSVGIGHSIQGLRTSAGRGSSGSAYGGNSNKSSQLAYNTGCYAANQGGLK